MLQPHQALIKRGRSYYVVSSVDMPNTGWETMIFRSTRDGKVTSYAEVVCVHGDGPAHDVAVSELDALLAKGCDI